MDSTAFSISHAGVERVGELEELWAAMYAHHRTLQEQVAPTRSLEDSWRRRREEYELWLDGEDAQLLIAERARRILGYAMLRLGPGPPTWDVGERIAELESLSVAAEARGAGVGAALLTAARATAKRAGAERMLVGVAHANSGALRFYEREGFGAFYVLLIDSVAAGA